MPGQKLFYTKKEFRADLYIDSNHQRLLVVDYDVADKEAFCFFLWKTARENNVGKILFPVRPYDLYFLNTGQFVLEGYIDGFFCGVPGCLLAGFPKTGRARNHSFKREQTFLMEILSSARKKERIPPPEITIEKAKNNDPALSSVFKEGFGELFLFPEKKKVIFSARKKGKVIAVAAAGLSNKYKRAEVAVRFLASSAQTSLGIVLFSVLLSKCRKLGLKCLYGLASASSSPENQLFSQAGFLFRGTLVNNCFQKNRLVNANLWVLNLT